MSRRREFGGQADRMRVSTLAERQHAQESDYSFPQGFVGRAPMFDAIFNHSLEGIRRFCLTKVSVLTTFVN